MKTIEFNTLEIGQMVFRKDGAGGQVSKINRTTKRICAIGIGDDVYWRYLHIDQPKNASNHTMCGVCGEYDIVEQMEFTDSGLDRYWI